MENRNMRMTQFALQEFFKLNRVREYDMWCDNPGIDCHCAGIDGNWVNVPFYYEQALNYDDRQPVNIRKAPMSNARVKNLGLRQEWGPEDVILSQGGNDFMRMQKRIMFPLGLINCNATAYTYEYLVEWFDRNGQVVDPQHLDNMFPARKGPPRGVGMS